MYSIDEIRYYDLLDPKFTREILDHRLSKKSLLQLQRSLNPVSERYRIKNKMAFHIFCRRAGLPTPRNLGAFHLSRTSSHDRADHRKKAVDVLNAVRLPNLILKPVEGFYGRGIYRVDARIEDHSFLCHDHVERSAGKLFDWMASESGFTRYLIQERLRGHSQLADLSGADGLQTVRMVTYASSGGGIIIGGCQLRIIIGGSFVDNYCTGRTGNLIGDIPSAGGVVADVYGRADSGPGFKTVTHHPSTGIRFRGFTIPLWRESCDLVRKAAVAFLPLRTIGWDVGITDRGPALVEGNATWDPTNHSALGEEILRAVQSDRP